MCQHDRNTPNKYYFDEMDVVEMPSEEAPYAERACLDLSLELKTKLVKMKEIMDASPEIEKISLNGASHVEFLPGKSRSGDRCTKPCLPLIELDGNTLCVSYYFWQEGLEKGQTSDVKFSELLSAT